MEQTIHDLLKCIGEVVPNSKSFVPTSVRAQKGSTERESTRGRALCVTVHTHTQTHTGTHTGVATVEEMVGGAEIVWGNC